jgi:hypothetical protein
VRAQAAILTVLDTQIATLEEQVKTNFGEHCSRPISRQR